MDYNSSITCRACLAKCIKLHALFKIFYNDLSLAMLLQNFLNVELEESDNFPTNLCEKCATMLIQFHNFSVLFEESTTTLQALVNAQTVDSTDKQIAEVDIVDDEVSKSQLETTVSTNEAIDTQRLKEISTDVIDDDSDIQSSYEKIYLLPSKENVESDGENDQTKCSVCEKMFDSVQQLKEHWKSHGENTTLICELCGYTTYKNACLDAHMQVHAKRKQYLCKFCGKSFCRQSVLYRHKKIHTNPKQIICEICGDSFTDCSTLKTHMLLLHLKTRKFKCMICDQQFPLKGILVKHLRRHQQKEGAVKDFTCSACSMQYFDKWSLKRHYDTKHSNVSKKCQFCSKAYTTKANLLKHINKHHKNEKFS